ncbi:peptidoglycan-binding protein LysM, partial [Bradyrhizobium genosp. SA-3]
MITASKAFIAFCLLAVGGTVLVIGPTELRRLLPGEAKTEVAVAAKPEVKAEPKIETKPELKPEPKPEGSKLAASAPPAPAASASAPEPKAG